MTTKQLWAVVIDAKANLDRVAVAMRAGELVHASHATALVAYADARRAYDAAKAVSA